MIEPPGFDIGQATMNQSAFIDKLAQAMLKAHAEIKNPSKNREVTVRTKSSGSYKFKYATLDAILSANSPILNKSGIVPMFMMRPGEIELRLIHAESGQWMASVMKMSGNGDIQGQGSEITYRRRYLLASMLCIAAEDDDDGNRAAGNNADADQPKSQGQRPTPQEASAPEGTDTWRNLCVSRIIAMSDAAGDQRENADRIRAAFAACGIRVSDGEKVLETSWRAVHDWLGQHDWSDVN